MDFKPFLISWNTTKRCNLRCPHCYLDATDSGSNSRNELTTEEGFALVDQIAELNPRTFLVLSGGEPLLRDDFMDLVKHASEKLNVLVGTNGVLLKDKIAKAMVRCGVKGVGISIDSIDPERHDSFRGLDGAWEGAIGGIETCKRHGLEFQIQTTVTKDNYEEISKIIEFSHKIGAKAFTLFFLVCTGRGQGLTNIPPNQYEEMLSYLLRAQDGYKDMMIRARCAPYSMRIAYQDTPFSHYASACYAGKHYCRITPEGEVTPCPYLPTSAGNVRKESFINIWKDANLFHQLRNPELKGKCGDCEFNILCGGCRARAYAFSGGYMNEDPWCLYEPKGRTKVVRKSKESSLVWTEEAERRMKKVPFFVRGMVKKELEAHARESGLKEVTPELMAEVKKKWREIT